MLGDATRWNTARAWAMAGLLAIGLSGGLAAVARADEVDDLREEVEQLKQQVLYLQNQIPGASAGGGAVSGGAAAQQEVRMQEFQKQLTDLTGQIERLELKVNDVADQLLRMQKDTEYRLGALEGTGGAPMVAAEGADQSQGAVTVETPTEQQAQVQNQSQAVPQGGQPGVLGTLSTSQAANLPQAPAGAAEDAASKAAQQTAMPSSGVVLPGETPREQYEYATGLVQRGAYDQAEIALRTFVAQHPNDELTGNAQYWLGETFYARSDYKSAAVAFAEGYQKYPNSAKAPDNLLKLAMALGQQGQKDNACVALRQLEKRYPDASANVKDRAIRAKKNYACT